MTLAQRGRARRRRLAPLAALALAVLPACADDPTNDPAEVTVPDVTSQNVYAEPAASIGEEVTVRGSVSEVLGPQAFTLAGNDFLGEALLVLSEQPGQLQGGQTVEVTGLVTQLDLEPAAGLGVDLGEGTAARFADANILVASSVTPA